MSVRTKSRNNAAVLLLLAAALAFALMGGCTPNAPDDATGGTTEQTQNGAADGTGGEDGLVLEDSAVVDVDIDEEGE